MNVFNLRLLIGADFVHQISIIFFTKGSSHLCVLERTSKKFLRKKVEQCVCVLSLRKYLSRYNNIIILTFCSFLFDSKITRKKLKMVIEVQPEQNTVPEPSNRSIPDDVPLINDIDMLRSLQEKPGLFSYRACKYLTFIISFHSFQSRLLQMVLFLVLLQ